MKIPKKFYNKNDKNYPVICRTTTELKKAVAELPDDIEIGEDCQIISVCNVNHEDMGTVLIFTDNL